MPASIDISEEPLDQLPQHGAISMAFWVEQVLQVELVRGGLGGMLLSERAVEPWLKDYVLPEVPFEALLAARVCGERVGGVLLASDPQGATLWDLRVAPAFRGQGIGRALFGAAEQWARARGCRQLVVETQNINVPACRLYASCGCELGAVSSLAYPELPGEVQLLWVKALV